MATVEISGLNEAEITPNSPKRLARVAGALYLLVGIFGGFAQGFVYPRVYVAGDAAATARNVLANSELVRVGVVSDLIQATVWVFVALALYRLLKHVNPAVAGVMVVLTAIGAGITCLNTIFEFEALQVATGAVSMGTSGTADSNALVLLLTDAHHYGLLTAQIFFALWLVPLGYLVYRSGWFPRALGIMLVGAASSYMVDMLAAFLFPDFGKAIHAPLSVLPAVAEIWMVGYLLVRGVRDMKVAGGTIPVTIAMPGAQA